MVSLWCFFVLSGAISVASETTTEKSTEIGRSFNPFSINESLSQESQNETVQPLSVLNFTSVDVRVEQIENSINETTAGTVINPEAPLDNAGHSIEKDDQEVEVAENLIETGTTNKGVPQSEINYKSDYSLLPSSAPSCSCPDEETLEYCQCLAPGGIINSRKGKNGTFVYNIPLSPQEKLIVYINKEETEFGPGNCSFALGDRIFNNETRFNDEKMIFIFEKSLNITENNADIFCQWSIAYRIGKENYESSDETSLEGTLKAPPDEDYFQLYRPMTHRLWNIVPDSETNCSLEVTVEKLDLGSSSPMWDGSIGNRNETIADFLAIGPGKTSLNDSMSVQDDTVLYGRSESPLTFTFDECKAHVLFVADMHYQNASGFTISYKVIKDEFLNDTKDSEKSASIHDQVQPKQYVVVNLNGVAHLNVSNVSMKFRKSIADMANRFLKKMKVGPIGNDSFIIEDDIFVNEIYTCNAIYCKNVCTSVNFTIDVKNSDGNWVFTKELLLTMLKDAELQDSWTFEDCEVCQPPDESSWKWLGLGGIVTVMIAIVIISLIYKLDEAIYNARNPRSRSSNDLSFLPSSAPASTSAQRFPPIRKKKEDSNFREPPGWNYNISGFEQFDAVGERVDPRSCGLDEEVVHDRTSVTFYSNSAFDGDEHELFSQAVLRRPQTPNENTVTSNANNQNEAYSSDESEIGDYESAGRNGHKNV